MFSYLYFKMIGMLRGIGFKDSVLGFDSKIEPGAVVIECAIDRHSYVGSHSTIINTTIGSFCSIANRVTIGCASHPMHFVSTSPVFLSHTDSVKTKYARHEYLPKIRTYIGNDVWIGEGVFIKAGIRVGTGAVVGMGAVVTKDVPEYAIVAGNPAKVLRYRFDQKLIAELLASEWWMLPTDRLTELGEYINEPSVFLEKLTGE
ncbi:CatB-related O-acetyltransferase [Simiduia curdlanivorans]|uniref:CatB-related O-acetyltransferase n=1 Tax=Simiduia curdlanivorans TaxID=1492769 RepID=A0ABV8V1J7_9GAMM|nr:CatB-related O-acetyltransferase [Simiduia curdlanivorans]MDN3639983.1 CatB-related O-acetyltransferase [Simiduia curdlanivorans]